MAQIPPSQRSYSLLAVGKPYHPDCRVWPEGADYNFRDGAHELRVFLPRASKAEIASVEQGPIEFRLMCDLPDLFVISRFHDKRNRRLVMSFDYSYSWHRVARTPHSTSSMGGSQSGPACRGEYRAHRCDSWHRSGSANVHLLSRIHKGLTSSHRRASRYALRQDHAREANRRHHSTVHERAPLGPMLTRCHSGGCAAAERLDGGAVCRFGRKAIGSARSLADLPRFVNPVIGFLDRKGAGHTLQREATSGTLLILNGCP